MKRLFLLPLLTVATGLFASITFDPYFAGVVKGKRCDLEIAECVGEFSPTSSGLPEGLELFFEYDDEDNETEILLSGTTNAAAGTYSIKLANGSSQTSFNLKVVEMPTASKCYSGTSTTLPVGGYDAYGNEVQYFNTSATATVSLTLDEGSVSDFTYSTSHSSSYGSWSSDVYSWNEYDVSWAAVKDSKTNKEGVSAFALTEHEDSGVYSEAYATVCLWNDDTATAYVGYYKNDYSSGYYQEIYIWEGDDEPGAPFELKVSDVDPSTKYLTYSIENEEVTITGTNWEYELPAELTIPETIEGYPVTTIGESAFSWCSALTSITIPDSVTTIGESAFFVCENLSSIKLSSKITAIPSSFASGCSALTAIEIPSGVTTIGESAFSECRSLSAIKVSSNVTTIGEYAFSDCSQLTSIDLETGIKTIGDFAFYECRTLQAITLPNSVTSIGVCAFFNCTSLKTANIPSKVEAISMGAFSNCEALNSVTFSSGVTTIGEIAFSNCTSLTSIDIPASVTTIGNYAFDYCTSLTSIEIPASVTTIGENAFANCTSLKTLTLRATPTEIGTGVFDSTPVTTLNTCTIPDTLTFNNLETVNFLEGTTKIDEYALMLQSELKTVTIPSTVTEIGSNAFSDCESLSSVTIESGLKTIGESAFHGCSALTSIELPDTLTAIGSYAFSHSALETVDIPSKVTTIGDSAFSECSSLTEIEIPDSITTIDNSTFSYCESLTSIDIPDSVTTIGDSAFYYCTSLASVTIPGSVSSIESYAFYTLSDSVCFVFTGEPVATVNYDAFSEATGTYPLAYQTQWKNVIDQSGYWNNLKMTCDTPTGDDGDGEGEGGGEGEGEGDGDLTVVPCEFDPYFAGVVKGKRCDLEIAECVGEFSPTTITGLPAGLNLACEYDNEDNETEILLSGTTNAAAGRYSVKLANATSQISFYMMIVEMPTASATCSNTSTTLPVGGYDAYGNEVQYSNTSATATVSLTLEDGSVSDFTYSTSHLSSYGDWNTGTLSWSESNISWAAVKDGKTNKEGVSAFALTEHEGSGVYYEAYATVCFWNDGTATAYVGYYEMEYGYNYEKEIYIWEGDDEPGAPFALNVEFNDIFIPEGTIENDDLREWLEQELVHSPGILTLASDITENDLDAARLFGVTPSVETSENNIVSVAGKVTFGITELQINGSEITLAAEVNVEAGSLPNDIQLNGTPTVHCKSTLASDTWDPLTPIVTLSRESDQKAIIMHKVNVSGYQFYKISVE